MDRNEAIKIVKSHYPANKQMLNEALEFLIPELAESEDEKIRKAILDYLTKMWGNSRDDVCGVHVEDAIAWLEKRGTVIKDAISMNVNSETEWDDIHKFLRMNLDGEKVKLLIVKEE